MLAKIEAGNVGTVLIKDMSRLGRDYLRVGLYMEMFREKGVRLIAVNENVDSFKDDDDFTPFRNIINESNTLRQDEKTQPTSGCFERKMLLTDMGILYIINIYI